MPFIVHIVAIDFACIFDTPFFSRTKNVPTRIVLIITVYIELDFSKNIESGKKGATLFTFANLSL